MLELGGERTAPAIAGAGPSTELIKKILSIKPYSFRWQSLETKTSVEICYPIDCKINR